MLSFLYILTDFSLAGRLEGSEGSEQSEGSARLEESEGSAESGVSEGSDASEGSEGSETSDGSEGSEGSEGHVCEIAYGVEPNYEDNEECKSYWSCEDYVGTLQHCHGTDQFHFQYKECMNDDDVSCWLQMEKHYHGFYDMLKTESSKSGKYFCT